MERSVSFTKLIFIFYTILVTVLFFGTVSTNIKVINAYNELLAIPIVQPQCEVPSDVELVDRIVGELKSMENLGCKIHERRKTNRTHKDIQI